MTFDQTVMLIVVFLIELLCGVGSVCRLWNPISLFNWATLLIFGTFCGVIFKSVAQFFALIFAYITPSLKSFNDILSSIF